MQGETPTGCIGRPAIRGPLPCRIGKTEAKWLETGQRIVFPGTGLSITMLSPGSVEIELDGPAALIEQARMLDADNYPLDPVSAT